MLTFCVAVSFAKSKQIKTGQQPHTSFLPNLSPPLLVSVSCGHTMGKLWAEHICLSGVAASLQSITQAWTTLELVHFTPSSLCATSSSSVLTREEKCTYVEMKWCLSFKWGELFACIPLCLIEGEKPAKQMNAASIRNVLNQDWKVQTSWAGFYRREREVSSGHVLLLPSPVLQKRACLLLHLTRHSQPGCLQTPSSRGRGALCSRSAARKGVITELAKSEDPGDGNTQC